MEVIAKLNLQPGGEQVLGVLDGLHAKASLNPIASQSKWSNIPLSTVRFSLSLGVQASTGSATVSGAFISSAMLRSANFEDAEIELEGIGSEVPGDTKVLFRKLRILNFTFQPLDAPEGADRIYTINFQDRRWMLQYGGIYGYFNKTIKIKDKVQMLTTTLKREGESGETPWTYFDLIQKIVKDVGFEDIEKPSLTTALSSGAPGIEFDSDALERLNEYPLNKDYRGQSPASIIAELLKEIDFTLTIKPDSTLMLSPLSGTASLSPLVAGSRSANSSAGAKYRPIPDKVYVVGGRVRDQIKIEPDLFKFQTAIERHELGKALDTDGALGLTTELTEEIEQKDFGLEPVCPDITGRIREFYDLLDTWDVDFPDIAYPYLHTYGKDVWRKIFSADADLEDTEAAEEIMKEDEKVFEEYNKMIEDLHEAGEAIPDYLAEALVVAAESLQNSRADYRKMIADNAHEQERAAGSHLYPEEEDFLLEHSGFDVLAEKVEIARQYFFKLYRIPEKVAIYYDWAEDDLSEIQEKFSPDAPQGIEEVDRSYILPIVPVIDEVREEEEEEEEEEDKQADKGKSAGDKLRERAGLKGVKKSLKERVRARFWGFGYGRSPDGIYNFYRQEFKEIGSRAVDLVPELGLVLFHEVPYIKSSYEGFSEDCPLVSKACPVAAEITYERKDPRLGILNFFVHELEKPGSIQGSPPSRDEELIAFEQIDELVEHLWRGEEWDRPDLVGVADSFAEEIWKKRVGLDASQTRTQVPAPIYAYPLGPLQSVSWSGGLTTFEVNTDYQAFSGTTMLDRIKRALRDKGIWHRTETLDQHLSEQRGFWPIRRTERFMDDERRILINTAHFGAFVIYDPDQKEDVIAISAKLKNATTHIHTKWHLGPLLCREPEGAPPVTYLATWIPLFGHNWWADNDADLCPYDHSHKIGGFYQPHTYMPAGGYSEPPIVKNPVEDLEDRFPRIIRLGNEGATDSLQKAQKFEDEPLAPEPEQELWKANPRTVPRDKDSNAFQAGILLEYCIADAVSNPMPGGPTSAVFYHEWQLIQKDEGFDSGHSNPFRTGNGHYVLHLPIAEAWTQHRQCFCPIGPIGTLQDYDEYVALFKRSYGADEDLYRGAVYITAIKWVWGWIETTPQEATWAPEF